MSQSPTPFIPADVLANTMSQMRSFDTNKTAGVETVLTLARPDSTEAALIQVDIAHGPILWSRILVAGDYQAQAAIQFSVFNHKVQMPRDWGDKADTGTEIIASLATGMGHNQLFDRFFNTVSETKELGPLTPLRALYREHALIRHAAIRTAVDKNKARVIAWKTRNNDRFLKSLEPDAIEKREGAEIYIWNNPGF